MLFAKQPKLLEIYIGKCAGENPPPAGGFPVSILNQMQEQTSVELIKDMGIVGDRWFGVAEFKGRDGKLKSFDHKRQVSLIGIETICKLQEQGFAVTASMLRRNLLTQNITLENLVGRSFQIGEEVILEGTKLCHSCRHIEEYAKMPGIMKALEPMGGLRSKVIQGGMIQKGDKIKLLS